MNPQVQEALEKIRGAWNSISLTHRIILSGACTVLVGLFIVFLLWVNKAEYSVLLSKLSPADANSVVTLLQADKVPYQLEENGTTIMVPKDKVYGLRLKVAGEGKLVGQGIGFEIFDNLKVGQTDFVQKINYQRALQGELARTIGEFPNVESARVHLVIPTKSLFIEEQQKPSSSVVIKFKDSSKKLEPKDVQSIVNMLVMAVEGLDPQHISIADGAGRVLYFPPDEDSPGLTSTQIEKKIKLQQGIERRIEELLFPVYGAGKVIAKVNVDIDFSQKTIRRELYDPNSSVVRSEQRSEESNRGQANLEAGTPDVNFRGDGVNGAVSNQEGNRETRTTNYEINKEEQSIVSSGGVERMSVAVVLDGVPTKGADGTMSIVPRSAEDLVRVKQLVSNAVGLDAKRGDSIEVTSISFGELEVEPEPNLADLVGTFAERMGKPLLNTLLAFLFLMLVVRPIVLAIIRPKVESGEMIEGLEGLPAAEEQLALYEAQVEQARAEEQSRRAELDETGLDLFVELEDIKMHAMQLAEQNMEQTVSIIRSWIRDGETNASRTRVPV